MVANNEYVRVWSSLRNLTIAYLSSQSETLQMFLDDLMQQFVEGEKNKTKQEEGVKANEWNFEDENGCQRSPSFPSATCAVVSL